MENTTPRDETFINVDHAELFKSEYLLTPDEANSIDVAIKERQEQIAVDKERFDDWSDKMTRRRMFALARLRKLNLTHNKRLKFYEEIKGFVDTTIDMTMGKVKAKDPLPNSSKSFSAYQKSRLTASDTYDSSDSGPSSRQSRQKVKSAQPSSSNYTPEEGESSDSSQSCTDEENSHSVKAQLSKPPFEKEMTPFIMQVKQ